MQVRTLPAVLKFLPSEKAQDARNFVQSLQYWLGGNAENLENLLLNIARAYTPALKGADLDVAEPQLFPDVGIWHPLAPSARPHDSPHWMSRKQLCKFLTVSTCRHNVGVHLVCVCRAVIG